VNVTPSQLVVKIGGCIACDSLPPAAAATVRPFVKPCAEFAIYIRWRPVNLTVAFIAESPPGTSEGYFYDPEPRPGYAEVLRRALFRILSLPGEDVSSKLTAFKQRGYMLLDAVKCRCKKTGPQPPQSVTKLCGRMWLQRELVEIGNPLRVCVLGKTALLALSQVAGFESLTRWTVSRNCGSVVKAGQCEILIWPFPSDRNSHILPRHRGNVQEILSRDRGMMMALALDLEDVKQHLEPAGAAT